MNRTTSHHKRGLGYRLLRFIRAQEAVAAVEFAIVLPVLTTLLLGAVEVTRFIIVTQKTEKAAMTISDLVAQTEEVTIPNLNVLVLAVSEVMQPFDFNSGGYVIITSVSRVGSAGATVNWQYTGGGTWTHASQIGSTGLPATLPSGFTLDPNEGIIVAEVYYNYRPMILNSLMPNNNTLYKLGIYKPRLGELTTIGS